MTQTLNWRKSAFSGGAEGNACVEIAELPTRIAVRDSKNPGHGTLSFPTGPSPRSSGLSGTTLTTLHAQLSDHDLLRARKSPRCRETPSP